MSLVQVVMPGTEKVLSGILLKESKNNLISILWGAVFWTGL